jgi:glycosyltransferase involved in cell wall biosynthesis
LKTIALIDYHQTGHHLTYQEIFGKSFLELGYRLVVFSAASKEVQQWLVDHCSSYKQHFHVFAMHQSGRAIRSMIGEKLPNPLVVLERWLYAAAMIRKASIEIGHSPDLVFFNCLDSYFSRFLNSHLINGIFPYKWAGLYLQAELELLKQNSSRRNRLHAWEIAQSSQCHAVGFLDRETSKKFQSKINNPVITFPDIADETVPEFDYEAVKQIQEKADGRTIVGLVGTLNKRKGLLTLLKAAQQCNGFYFVFAGQLVENSFSAEELLTIKNLQANLDNCFFHFERIPDESQFNAMINVCDIMFAAYENFPNSSNILTKAAIFKKPTIVSRGFCMDQRVNQFNLGLAIPEGDVAECLRALQHLEHELNADDFSSKFGFEEYRQLNSLQKLKETLLEIVENKKIDRPDQEMTTVFN